MDIQGHEYKVRRTVRGYIAFEQLTGKAFKVETITDQVNYAFCVLAVCNPEWQADYETWLSWLDEDPTLLRRIFDELGADVEEAQTAGAEKKS